MLRLFNTASRKTEEFKSIQPGKAGMYTCGPTVYWDAHIGNFRSYVFEDVLLRALEMNGYEVTRVVNITDVGHLTDDADLGEDKIEQAARKAGKTAWEIAEEYTKRFIRDAEKLNVRLPKPPLLCKATDHIQDQIELVKILESKGFTYKTSDGVYFDTAKFPTYGSFGGQRTEEKEEGARVAANPEKRNKADFALWKLSNPRVAHPERSEGSFPRQNRHMEWDSPWGVGFPGWHLECSAMSQKYLGQPFDIHCGGIDHIPVHHENEIAQSQAAYGVKLANYWLHNEFLTVDGQKMSKSLGNVYTLSDVEERGFDPLALRLFYLGAHYRQKLNFTWDALQAAQNALRKLRNAVRDWEEPALGCAEIGADFKSAINDDLNTPKALAVMWKTVDSSYPTSAKASTLLKMDAVLGLDLDGYIAKPVILPTDVKTLADERSKAREKQDWTGSDRLRAEIESRGWTVEDTSEGQRIFPK